MLDSSTLDLNTSTFTESNSTCPMPWKQVHITTKGEVYPCCLWTGQPMGSLRRSFLDSIWNREGFKGLRRAFLRGEKPKGCEKCWLAEETGMRSPRWYACRKYLDFSKNITGDEQEDPIECWDIRFSNVCNLACRMCGPESSTKWYSDGSVLYGENWVEEVRRRVNQKKDSERLLNTLLDSLERTSEIYFVGGEPLIMPEHYKVLETILERKLSGIYLRYNSNLTTLGPEDRVLTLWQQLIELGNKVEVGASIDGTGELAEYVRYGCKWEVVESNLKKLQNAQIPVKIMPTVSVLNVYWMPEFLDWCISRGYETFDWDVALPNFVVYPQYYDIRVLPEEDKLLVCEKCNSYLEDNKNSKNRELQKNFIEPIVTRLTRQELSIEEQKAARQEFCRVNRTLDRLRNQDWKKINGQFRL